MAYLLESKHAKDIRMNVLYFLYKITSIRIMTITELQNKLQEISENYGDIEIKVKETINWNESYYFDDFIVKPTVINGNNIVIISMD
jgi:hypothetical protein